jgi:hypothetical protein
LLELPATEVGNALAEMFDDYEPGITWPRVGLNEGTVPPGFAHEPWNWLDNPLPAPIVDHKVAFREARARWGNQKQVLLPREDVLHTHV